MSGSYVDPAAMGHAIVPSKGLNTLSCMYRTIVDCGNHDGFKSIASASVWIMRSLWGSAKFLKRSIFSAVLRY